jgi:hypothetical protein
VLSTGLFWLVRRRGTDDADSDESHSDDVHSEPARRSEA